MQIFLAFAVLTSLFSIEARSACLPGAMAKLTKSMTVHYGAEEKAAELPVGTEVHVTLVAPEHIEIYAMKDGSGEMINGLGTIKLKDGKRLTCQDN